MFTIHIVSDIFQTKFRDIIRLNLTGFKPFKFAYSLISNQHKNPDQSDQDFRLKKINQFISNYNLVI